MKHIRPEKNVKEEKFMTAIIEARPRISRLAMVFIAAVVVLLLTAPKAGAWDANTDDGFKVSRTNSYGRWSDVTVTGYTGSDTDITFPTKVTYGDSEFTVTNVGEGVLKNFKGVSGVKLHVTIPEGYTDIGLSAMNGLDTLETVSIPSTVTSISSSAFYGCTGLKTVTIADGENDLTVNTKVFGDCSSLTSLELPARLSSWGAGNTSGCTSLTNISLASGCEKYYADGAALYQLNDDGNGYTLISYATGRSETDYSIASEVNGKPVTGIFRMVFQNNAKLQSVTTPASVTDFQYACFDGCSALKKITIGATENVTFGSNAFTGLPSDSVIEVANEAVQQTLTAATSAYTAGNTTVQVKSSQPEPEATPAAALTLKGTGVKDGYSYYKLTLDSAANVSTMIVNLSFDASQVSKDAQAEGKKGAYIKLNDNRFMIPTQTWKEEDGKVKVSILLTPANNQAITSEDASNLLLLGLPVKANVTGNLTATVDSAECAGVVSNVSTKGTVTVNGSPASNRITSYDVNADSVIDILDITEAQRFYQASNSDEDWATAQKADVNADGQVDIQDLIDIFLQIQF